jgi:hypothetical protein
MTAALAVMDVREDKSKAFRCGAADKALASSESEPRLKDCRSFTDGTRTFALASLVDGDTVRWMQGDIIVHEAKFTAEKLQTPDRFLYQVPFATVLPGAGVLIASREDGGLVLSRRDATLARFGKPSRFWLGAATTMPALSMDDHDVVVMFALQGQRDLWGAGFALEAKDIPKHVPNQTLNAIPERLPAITFPQGVGACVDVTKHVVRRPVDA